MNRHPPIYPHDVIELERPQPLGPFAAQPWNRSLWPLFI
jgi:hypothetical protein